MNSDSDSEDSLVAVDLKRLNSGASTQSVTSTRSCPLVSTSNNTGRRRSAGSLEDVATKKNNKATERLAKKQKLAEEKAAKKAAKEMYNIYKPGECIKHINVEVHPSLFSQWYMADVSREVGALGAKVVPDTDMFDSSLIMWSINVQPKLGANNGQMGLTSTKERCDAALYVATVQAIEEQVSSHSLAKFMSEIKLVMDGRLTLVVFGAKDYFKGSSARRTQNSNKKITELNLEMAITDLIVSADCDTAVVNTPNELALLIAQFTKANAEAPYKKAKKLCEEQVDFYMKGDNKKCVPLDKDGNGISRLWQQMLAILPNSSLEISRSICSQYQTPKALYEALQLPNSINELSSLAVHRAGPGSKSRRLGPERATSIHSLMTQTDGNVIVK